MLSLKNMNKKFINSTCSKENISMYENASKSYLLLVNPNLASLLIPELGLSFISNLRLWLVKAAKGELVEESKDSL